MEYSDAGEGILQDLVNKNYINKFGDLADVNNYLGADPVVAKFALITTEKDGIIKHRLILDCRISGSNSHARKSERILLPRAWHVIKDALQLGNLCVDGESLVFAVCDFTDAFFMIPLHRDEQRYFVASYRGAFYVWLRAAQGSVNGPNVFGRLSAWVGRCTQACFDDAEARLHIYSDDPNAIVRGASLRQRRIIAVILFSWLLMGFTLAVQKAQWGRFSIQEACTSDLFKPPEQLRR